MTCALLSRDGPCISAVVCLGVITLCRPLHAAGMRRRRSAAEEPWRQAATEAQAVKMSDTSTGMKRGITYLTSSRPEA
jgi:hypothetical protein